MHNQNYKRSAAYNKRIGDLGLDFDSVSTDDSTGVSLITPGADVTDDSGSYTPNVPLTDSGDDTVDTSGDDLGLGTYSSTPEEGDSTLVEDTTLPTATATTTPVPATGLQSVINSISSLLSPSKTTVPSTTTGTAAAAPTAVSTLFTPTNLIIAGVLAFGVWNLTKKKKR